MEYGERISPYEKALIGICLNEREAEVISTGLLPDAFYNKSLSEIYTAVLKASVIGESVNLLTLSKYINNQNYLSMAVDCLENYNSTMNVKEMARVIKEASQLRKATKQLYEIYHSAVQSDPLNPFPIFEKLSNIDNNGVESNKLDQFHGDILVRCREIMQRDLNKNVAIGFSTGFKVLDQYLGGGFSKGRVITLGARPGGGKTTLATNFAYNAMIRGEHPIYFTIEMNSLEITDKFISLHSGIEISKISNRILDDDEIDRYIKATNELYANRMSIASRTGGNWEKVLITIRNAVRYHGVSFVIIDYIQQYRMTKRLTQREELDLMMNQIKDIANDLQVPILVITQLNRDIEKRSDSSKDPKMSDIKESGTIEQASDAVLILSYENTIDGFDRLERPNLFLYIVKNRWGKQTKIPLETKFEVNLITEKKYHDMP